MLIEVTDEAGIRIPRFCYHKKLSIAANCRMCLVEVENVPKPLPACATPVSDGMKVHTRSPAALAAQKGTMEFLLINHPLDCPICDQGGECELQDVAMGYGGDVSRMVERKRVVADEDLGPLIATDMTRCIHCTRCVRFGSEVAGLRELGATGRGEHMRIGTYVKHTVASEMSGNVIDLCPVGALTSKPFRFKARAWELVQRDGVAPHDSVGSNLHLHLRSGQVMRVHPRENEAINETWISDRDRFSYEGLYSEDRLYHPLVKHKGEWQQADWEDALKLAAEGLRGVAAQDPTQLGVLLSSGSTLEEMFLAQQLARSLGSPNIDCRLRQVDFRGDATDPQVSWLGRPISDMEQLDAALLVGSNVRKDQPIIAHRLRKAALKGAAIAFVNPIQCDLHFPAIQRIVAPAFMVAELAAVAAAAGVRAEGALQEIIAGAQPAAEHESVAQHLKAAERASIMLGNLAQSHPDYAILRQLSELLAKKVGGEFGILPEAANSVGAQLAGALPHRGPGAAPLDASGLDARGMLEQSRAGYLLFGVEPAYDFWNPTQADQALRDSDIVVALTAYRSPSLEAVADVMLPVAAFTETSGTYVNAEGVWQAFNGVAAPGGEARPGWKVLRVLANLLDVADCDYVSSEEIRDELATACGDARPDNSASRADLGALRHAGAELERIGEVPIYACDAIVRRAVSLQKAPDATDAVIRINPAEASRAGLSEGALGRIVQNGFQADLPVAIDQRVPDGCVWVPAAVAGSETLGGQFGAVALEKV
jgi:NADH-quinone oxidoreductase subunit G